MDEGGEADEVVVQEVVEGAEAFVAGEEGGGGGEGGVLCGGRERDGVAGGEAEEEGGGEGAFEVDVVFAFGEGGEEGVEGGVAHSGMGLGMVREERGYIGMS